MGEACLPDHILWADVFIEDITLNNWRGRSSVGGIGIAGECRRRKRLPPTRTTCYRPVYFVAAGTRENTLTPWASGM